VQLVLHACRAVAAEIGHESLGVEPDQGLFAVERVRMVVGLYMKIE